MVTEFRGRSDEIHVWPLSFKEFMSAYEGSMEDGWEEYLMYGGLPQLLTQEGDDKKAEFIRRLYRTVYLRDIYERNTIDLKPEFEDFVCNKGSERIYILSAWRVPDEEKMEQDKRSLRLVGDSFRRMVVVGENTKPWRDDDGIRVVSIYDFMLNARSTEVW